VAAKSSVARLPWTLAAPVESETRSRSPTPPLPPRRRPSDSSPQYNTAPRRKPVPEPQIPRVSVIEDYSSIEPSQTQRQKGAYTSIESDEGGGQCPPKPFYSKIADMGILAAAITAPGDLSYVRLCSIHTNYSNQYLVPSFENRWNIRVL
jgi:hypothetical protein